MQVPAKSTLPTMGLGNPDSFYRTIIPTMGHSNQPTSIVCAKMSLQQGEDGPGQLAHRANSQRMQFFLCLGPNTINYLHTQRPDSCGYLVLPQDSDPARLFQIGSNFGHKLIGRHPDGATQLSALIDLLLQSAC